MCCNLNHNTRWYKKALQPIWSSSSSLSLWQMYVRYSVPQYLCSVFICHNERVWHTERIFVLQNFLLTLLKSIFYRDFSALASSRAKKKTEAFVQYFNEITYNNATKYNPVAAVVAKVKGCVVGEIKYDMPQFLCSIFICHNERE